MSPNNRAEHYIDVTEAFDRKITALTAHTSRTAHTTDLDERMQDRPSAAGTMAGHYL